MQTTFCLYGGGGGGGGVGVGVCLWERESMSQVDNIVLSC